MLSGCNYIIGDALLRIEGRGAALNQNSCFAPFKTGFTELPPAMHFFTQEPFPEPFPPFSATPVIEFDYMDIHEALYPVENGYMLLLRTLDGTSYATRYTYGSPEVRSNVACNGFPPPFLFYHLLRNMYSFCALPLQLLPVHGSVAVYREKAVLFVGPSGTGKSTHTALWRTHIPGTGSLNDDSPLLKITPQGPRVYGSPWSGKLPVYINRSYPLAAVVRLYQASANIMRKQSLLAALGHMMENSSSLLMQDDLHTDLVCDVFSRMLKTVPVYTLECLPDKEAALLALQTLIQDGCL